jgi:hypothetical protein
VKPNSNGLKQLSKSNKDTANESIAKTTNTLNTIKKKERARENQFDFIKSYAEEY